MFDLLKSCAVLSLVMSGAALAAGGTPQTDVAWPHPGEVLRYHSCGCGDACWVADVVDVRTQRVEGRLHCDCENLSFSLKPDAPEAAADLGRCEAINASPDKLQAIRARLEELMPRR